jgi:cobalt-zinc-cadmium resistance protein CzcA
LTHPRQKYFDLQEQVILKEKEVLFARTLPDITVGYVNQTLVGMHYVNGADQYFDNSHRFQAGQIGLEIPLFFGATKRRSSVLDTEIDQNSIKSEYAYREMESGLNQILLKYNSLMSSLNMYRDQLIPQTSLMKEQADILLESGEISMIEFLQTKQAVIDIEMNYNQLKNEINTTVHQLNWFVQNKN